MGKLKIVMPRCLPCIDICGLYQLDNIKKRLNKGNYNYIILFLEKSFYNLIGIKWLGKWIWGIVVDVRIVFIVAVPVVVGVVVLVVVVFVVVVVVVVAIGVVVASKSFSESFS